jgi:predicted small secreted protein
MRAILRMALLACVAGGILLLSACNTTKGAGKDMQSAGENIQHQAEKSGAH